MKERIQTEARNKKDQIDEITCTLKRVTAEKQVLETEHLTLKTQKTMENQDGALAELRKTETKLRKLVGFGSSERLHFSRQLESSEDTVKQKDNEIEFFKKKVVKLELTKKDLETDKAFLSGCLDEEKTKFEALMATHTTEMEEVHAVYEGKRADLDGSNMKKELEKIKRESDKVFGMIRELEILRSELAEAKESYELLAAHSTPACVAAVKRIEVLKKELQKVQANERLYNVAEATLDEYVLLEDPANWAMMTNARGHLTMAQEGRVKYENELIAKIERIRRNVPQYFLLHDCHVDLINPYPEPFTEQTRERLRILREDPVSTSTLKH